ncbi:MAG: FkbM family methyltransferase [Chitinivibrionales bacterium]|nr:FkbM family methyltransferase [Chitinivibrionales bacterium]
MLPLRFLYRAWRYRLVKDRREILWVRSNLNKGDVVVDIGAHKGAYLYWLRRAVGHTGMVYAFEPQALLAGYLRGIISRARWENVLVAQKALSAQGRTLDFFVPAPSGRSSPGAHIGPKASGAEAHSFPVEAVALDEFFRGKESERLRLIKCDVEGHELEVFQGAADILRRRRPALLFECEQRHLGKRPMGDVFLFLRELGYDGFFFHPSGLRPIAEFSPQHHQPEASSGHGKRSVYCNNFLFQAK